jgi:hypothetical protein
LGRVPGSLIAVLLALPTAWHRETSGRITGALGAAVACKPWGLELAFSGMNFLLAWVMSYLKQPVPTGKPTGREDS